MENRKFDNSIKAKFKEHASQVPEAVWAGIEANLPKKKKRYLIPFVLLFLGLATTGLWFFNQYNQGLKEAKTIQRANKSDNQIDTDLKSASIDIGSELKEKVSNTKINSSKKANSTSSQIEIIGAEKEMVSANATIILKNSFRNKDDVSTKGISAKERTANSENSFLNKNVVQKNKKVNSIENSANVEQNNEEIEISNKSILISTQQIKNSNNEIKAFDGRAINSTVINAENDFDLSHEKNNELLNSNVLLLENNSNTQLEVGQEEAKNKNAFLALEKRPISLALINSNSKKSIFEGIKLTNGNVICAPKIFGATRAFLDFNIGPLYAQQQLSLNDSEAKDYLELRKTSEDYLSAFNISVRGGIVYQNGMSLATGINYTRINEKFKNNSVAVNSNNQVVDVAIVVTQTPGGADTTIVVRNNLINGEQHRQGRRKIQHVNQLNIISLPLTVGYVWTNKKFDFSVQAGPQFNFAFWQKGKIAGEDGDFYNLDTEDNVEVYKNNAGLSVIGSFGVHYNTGKNLQFTIEPNINYTVRSVTTNAHAVKQKYLNYGVQFGLRKLILKQPKNKIISKSNLR